jgi:membrane associated rhomboid family serine protease
MPPGLSVNAAGTGDMSSAKHRAWTLGTDDAESLVAEARRALFVMVAFLAILWLVQLINVADHYQLDRYGIRPRDLASLPYILTAPFLHVSWTHIESNSGPLFIFGFLAAYRGVVRFLSLTALLIVVSGLAAWFFGAAGTIGVGASGVVFGYLGYILVRGFFDRHGIDILIGAVMALCFAYQFTVLLPQAGIGWQDHIGGLVGGVVGGWLFRDRGPRPGRRRPATAASGSLAQTLIVPAAGAAAGRTPAGAPQAAGSAAAGAGSSPARRGQDTAGSYPGARADLHRELDDLGL